LRSPSKHIFDDKFHRFSAFVFVGVNAILTHVGLPYHENENNMKTESSTLAWLNLPNLPLSLKTLFVGYLLVIGVGLCMAGLQILLTHGMADGKFGLSVDDIVYSYYGDKEHSKLASKLNGSMIDKAPLLNGQLKARRKINGNHTTKQCLHNTVLCVTDKFQVFLTLLIMMK
jgi:hypothetical protein